MSLFVLSSGYTIYLDDEDDWIRHTYLLGTMKTKFGHTRYVTLRDKRSRKYVTLLHRKVMKIENSEIRVDHENGNGLDCRRNNLRITNGSLNQYNRRKTNGDIGLNGVNWSPRTKMWRARLINNGVEVLSKCFKTEKEAIDARRASEKIYCEGFEGIGTTFVNIEK